MASRAPIRFWTTLKLSGAKCYVLEPVGKAKLQRQRAVLNVIDQWAVQNKAKSIILSKGGIHDSTKTPGRWGVPRDEDKDHIAILASTPKEFDKLKASPFHLFVVDPKASELELKSSIPGGGPRPLREDEVKAVNEAEANFSLSSELDKEDEGGK